VDNPFVGATGYRNPDYAASVAQSAATRTGDIAAAMNRTAGFPTAVWLNSIAAITASHGLRWHLDAALAQSAQQAQQGIDPTVVVTIVLNDVPGRDCRWTYNTGELDIAANGVARYKSEYVDPIAAILADPAYASLRIATVIEPGALGNLITSLGSNLCGQAPTATAYIESIRYALNKLNPPANVYNYLDASPSWAIGYEQNHVRVAQLLTTVAQGTTAGLSSVDGFAINTAGYVPVVEPYLTDPYATLTGSPIRTSTFFDWSITFDEQDFVDLFYADLLSQGFPSSIGFLIDTSRNGWGGPNRPTGVVPTTSNVNTYVDALRIDRRALRSNWCNQAGAGLGPRPQSSPLPHVDAYVWVKPPGESDGAELPPGGVGAFAYCDQLWSQPTGGLRPSGALAGGTPYGTWFDAYFEALVRNAYPAV
jgi:cellulose 1,4-beta-cellobiosidase